MRPYRAFRVSFGRYRISGKNLPDPIGDWWEPQRKGQGQEFVLKITEDNREDVSNWAQKALQTSPKNILRDRNMLRHCLHLAADLFCSASTRSVLSPRIFRISASEYPFLSRASVICGRWVSHPFLPAWTRHQNRSPVQRDRRRQV